MMKAANDLPVSAPQMEFLSSEERSTLFCGGIGSGKTHAGALWVIFMVYKYPGVSGCITANTYGQLQKATLATLFKLLNEYGIDHHYVGNKSVLYIGKTTIFCFAMEKYDNIRGIEVGWAWSDECAFYKEEAFDVLQGRIRDVNGPRHWRGTTTPNGFNWLYKRFVTKPSSSSRVVNSKTSDNVDNLHQDYVSDLYGQYDTKLSAQELDGEFINLTSGKVYYSFDRKYNCAEKVDDGSVIFVGLDFNVHPLCGVYVILEGDKIFVVDELYLENSNTFKAAKEIKVKYESRKITVVADSTGDRRKTSAVNTDHQILRDTYLDVAKFRNPYVKDRYNNTNRLFHQNKLFISKKCTHLLEDLEQLVYDNKDDMLSHISDALGYICWYLDPLKKPNRPATVKYY